ncbi:MAG: DUF2314 domain-containing protein [Treponema sp.]|nr:DUF2314 domain-containing protein [Treponema sp.]
MKKRRPKINIIRTFIIFLCISLFLSCHKQIPGGLTEEAEPSDEALLQIAEDARRTLPIFFRNMTRADTTSTHFSIKYPFTAKAGSGIATEQIWLTNIQFNKGTYYGVITSTPRYLVGIRKGRKVPFNPGEITDWMYIQNGKITGGLSIQYFLLKVPENELTAEQRILLEMFD